MSAAVCPYCRTPIEPDSGEQLLCTGCGTPHHADCYAENGGCTVFGCSAAPAEEPKLHLSGSDLANLGAPRRAPMVGLAPGSLGAALQNARATPAPVPPSAVRAKAPPPPPPPPSPGAATAQISRPAPRVGVGSMFFDAPLLPVPAQAAAPAFDFNLEPDPNAKNRSTFIVLGALLGFFGAHNFYAGYTRKAVAQLCLTAFTLGFAGFMSWVWAVIDVCTIDHDSTGIKFRT
jgi:TM2 domain-containing membrane protein YozV